MMNTTWNSDPNELNYYADVKEREEEIRKQNQELDKKLNSVTEDNSNNIPSVDISSLDLSPPFKHKKGNTIKCIVMLEEDQVNLDIVRRNGHFLLR